MRPTFLVIGAMKCGTTSLWRYLRAHPQVQVAGNEDGKEIHFFSREWERGWQWYEEQFASANASANAGAAEVVAIGEASPSYAELHFYPEVPDRIAAHLPDVRVIYLVRDPIDRVRSHYRHNVDHGIEHAPLESAVWSSETYTGIGRYSSHVDAYLSRFPSDQLLVVRSELLRHDRPATLERIANFLGIDATWPNSDEEFLRAPTLVDRVHRDWRRGPAAIARAIRDQRRIQRMALMSDALRTDLVELFRPEVAGLRAHLDPEFDGWGIG